MISRKRAQQYWPRHQRWPAAPRIGAGSRATQWIMSSPIKPGRRQNPEQPGRPPRPAKPSEDEQRRPGPAPARPAASPIIRDHVSRGGHGEDAQRGQVPGRRGPLQGGKMEQAPRIAREHEPDESMAESAPAVMSTMGAQMSAVSAIVGRQQPWFNSINMFTDNSKPRKRGRPPSQTQEGEATRRRIYQAAIALIGERGYEGATLRQVATRIDVSPGPALSLLPEQTGGGAGALRSPARRSPARPQRCRKAGEEFTLPACPGTQPPCPGPPPGLPARPHPDHGQRRRGASSPKVPRFHAFGPGRFRSRRHRRERRPEKGSRRFAGPPALPGASPG